MEFYTGLTGKDTVLQTFDFSTLDTAAYASGDILTSSAIAVSSARYLGMGGVIERIILKETTSGTLALPDLRLWIFGDSITPAARNSPQAFISSQLSFLVGYIDIAAGSWINGATGVAINTVTPALHFVCQPTSKTLYIVPECKSAETYASGATITGQIVITRN
jgi:hypothetical protein